MKRWKDPVEEGHVEQYPGFPYRIHWQKNKSQQQQNKN